MKKLVTYLLILAMTLVLLPADVSSAAMSVKAVKSLTVTVGKSKTIKLTGKNIVSTEFSSSRSSIAKVNDAGKVTGKKTGTTIIRTLVSDGSDTRLLKTVVTVVKKARFSAAKVYKKMLAKKKKYPEGKYWTNANGYLWKAVPNVRFQTYGCAAFASILSDAAFGKKTVAKKIKHPAAARIRVGDILRMGNDSHSVVVLKVTESGFVIAEGNFNSSIHWGRKISKNAKIDYLYTRYEG